eukprot:RCo049164
MLRRKLFVRIAPACVRASLPIIPRCGVPECFRNVHTPHTLLTPLAEGPSEDASNVDGPAPPMGSSAGASNMKVRRDCALGEAKKLPGQKAFQILSDLGVEYIYRGAEANMLKRLLSSEPHGLLCLVGPINVGKTTLLKSALENRPVAMLNLHKHSSINTTEELTRILLKQFRVLAEHAALKQVSENFGLVRVFGFELQMAQKDAREEEYEKFGAVLDSIENALQITTRGIADLGVSIQESRPVLAIASGSRLRPLTNWKGSSGDEGRRVLKRFFRWCVFLSAHLRLCHVLITTNDGLFVQWMQHEFALSHYLQSIAIGDPTMEAAEQFVAQLLRKLPRDPLVPQVPRFDLPVVTSQLGTRFTDLQHFVESCLVTETPQEAIEHTLAIYTRQIIQGLRPHSFRARDTKTVTWTAGLWLALMRLLDARDGVVPYGELCHGLFFEDTTVLHSLCHHGLV